MGNNTFIHFEIEISIRVVLIVGVPVKEGTFSIIEPSIPGIIMAVLQYTSNTGAY